MKKEPIRERLLIVDDDSDLCAMLREALERPGRHIDLVNTRTAAEAALRTTRYNLVLADIFLPDTTMLELVDFIREIDLDYPVVLMSGALTAPVMAPDGDSTQEPDFLRLLADRRGVLQILEKPFDIRLLQDTIDRILKEYQ